MSFYSDTHPIIEKALEHFVPSEEATCSNADDGRPSTNERTSGIPLCEASGDGAVAMSLSSDSTPITENALEPVPINDKKMGSIAGDGQSDISEGETGLCADGGATAAAQRRGAPGVNSSNTPPQSSKNNKNDPLWIAAEDWLEWSSYVDWGTNWPKLSRELSEAKEYATYKNCPDEKRSILFWGGRALVDRMGARLGNKKTGLYFAYKLQFGDLAILIADHQEPHKTKPSVVIRATGGTCLFMGANEAYEEGNRFIEEMGGKIVGNKLSRVDICLDMPGITMAPFDQAYMEERYICRAKSHGRYCSCGTTVQFGKYPTMLRIYDKKAEAIKKGHALPLLRLKEYRWGGQMPASAIRVEFELGRDFLKKKGVDSVEDYYLKRGALLNYLTHSWMRFTQDQVDRENKNQSKARTLPIWDQVREAFLEWAGTGENVSLAPLDKTKANVSHLIKVAVGVVKTAARDQGAKIGTLDDFLTYLQEKVRLYGVDCANK